MIIFHLFTLTLIFMVHVSVDAQTQFDSFLLYFSHTTPGLYRFPLNEIPSISDANTRAICPAEADQDKRNLDILSRTYPQAKYCLFLKKDHRSQPKYCTEPPKPCLELQRQYTKDETICGTTPDHKEFRIGFYFCGVTWMMLDDFRKKPNEPDLIARFQLALDLNKSGRNVLPKFYTIYNLCIDTLNGKTIWTKHDIMTPLMFTENEEKLQRESGGDPEISTDPILFAENTFTDLKRKFEAQNEEPFKMTENFMVPKEHVALRTWRAAVNHFINVAPLWDKLGKLMKTVDQAIKKISLQLDENDQRLTVYTRAIDSIQDETTIQVNSQFSSTVWYKLLYENRTHAAALIVLHNTPIMPPKMKACEVEMICDVKKWYEKNQDDDEEISEEVFEYVYCCNPTASEALKLFNFEFFISGPLNLDGFF